MPRYFVNRSDGWPISDSRESKYKLADEFESESTEDANGVAQGYLLICGEPAKQPEGMTSPLPQLKAPAPGAPLVAGTVPLHLVKDEEPEPSGSPLPDQQ
jgi:hypothetical protein